MIDPSALNAAAALLRAHGKHELAWEVEQAACEAYAVNRRRAALERAHVRHAELEQAIAWLRGRVAALEEERDTWRIAADSLAGAFLRFTDGAP